MVKCDCCLYFGCKAACCKRDWDTMSFEDQPNFLIPCLVVLARGKRYQWNNI